MSVSAHITSLLIKEKQLERDIHEAYVHHLPLVELKKRRLVIKDEIQTLSSRMG